MRQVASYTVRDVATTAVIRAGAVYEWPFGYVVKTTRHRVRFYLTRKAAERRLDQLMNGRNGLM